jgi:hypothetical protein
MSTDSLIPITPKKAKEHKHRTVLYSHECPYCGDPCDDYDVSIAGQEMECVCGEKYEVVK